jgi:hypothetical protein
MIVMRQNVLLFLSLTSAVLALICCALSFGTMSAGGSCNGLMLLIRSTFTAQLLAVFVLERLPVAWWAEGPD